MTMPCTNSPEEVIEKIVSAKANADKFDKFVNGTNMETVQLGSGSPTPVIRNVVRQMFSSAAELPNADVSGKTVIANGGSETISLAERFYYIISPKDFGAVGDGSTDDTAAFEALEEAVAGRMVDLNGMSYAVDAIPDGNCYYNGSFVVDGRDCPAYVQNIFAYWNPDGIEGFGPGNGDLNFFISDGVSTPGTINGARGVVPHLKDVIAIGNRAAYGAIKNNTYLADCIAIGCGVMSDGEMTSSAEHNIGIGEFALHSVTSGDRNIALGSLSMPTSTTADKTIAIGRDSAGMLNAGNGNVFIGYSCFGGLVHTGLDGKYYAFKPSTQNNLVAIGMYCLNDLGKQANYITAVGERAAEHLQNGSYNVFIGNKVCQGIDNELSYNGKIKVVKKPADDGTYVSSGSSIVVTCAGHSAEADCYVIITFTSGACKEASSESQLLYVSAVSGDTFTLVNPTDVSIDGSGDCTISTYETSTSPTKQNAYSNVAIGAYTCDFTKEMYRSIVVGGNSCQASDTSLKNSVIVGEATGNGCTSFENTVTVGKGAGPQGGANNRCACFGYEAGYVMNGTAADIQLNTAVGHQAMKLMQDGTTSTSALKNSTSLGFGARVSGSNQVQLGNADTTVYAYGSVQDRSDARDKADVRDTELGLDFLLALRPVDFRWDYRDDYIETVEHEVETVNEEGETVVEVETEVVRHEKDGSRKRSRYHHGLIAQEVKAVLDARGIDFGGYQDHKINGGNDILTIGYEEFVGPIIKSLQEIDARLKALEA